MTPTIGWTMTVVALAQVTEAPGGLAMTPTFGWVMTVVALVAVIALGLCMRRSKRRISDKPDFKPIMRKTVDVIVKECDEKNFSIEVDPSEVGVKPGEPLQWDFTGPANAKLTIKPKDEVSWPFPGPPLPAKAAPKVPVKAGNAKGNAVVGSRHKYWVVVECDGRTFNIDPDIYIFDW